MQPERRQRRIRKRAIVLPLVLPITFTHCSSDSESSESVAATSPSDTIPQSTPTGSEQSSTTTSGDVSDVGRLAVQATEPNGGMEALIKGEVAIEGGCPRLITSDQQEYGIVWPAGTWWDAGANAVVSTGGTRIVDGSRLAATGGYVPAADLVATVGEALASKALACAPSGAVVLYNGPEQPITVT